MKEFTFRLALFVFFVIAIVLAPVSYFFGKIDGERSAKQHIFENQKSDILDVLQNTNIFANYDLIMDGNDGSLIIVGQVKNFEDINLVKSIIKEKFGSRNLQSMTRGIYYVKR